MQNKPKEHSGFACSFCKFATEAHSESGGCLQWYTKSYSAQTSIKSKAESLVVEYCIVAVINKLGTGAHTTRNCIEIIKNSVSNQVLPCHCPLQEVLNRNVNEEKSTNQQKGARGGL